MKCFTVARVNDSTTKVSQPEISFPARPESNIHNERERNGPNSIQIERKGTLAIGSFSFTDSPPNEYGIISKGKGPWGGCRINRFDLYSLNFIVQCSLSRQQPTK